MVYFVNWLWVDSTVYMVKTSQDSLLKRILINEPHLTSIPKTELLKNSLTKTRLIWSNSCIKKGLKVYLCYKTINSWNVPSKVQIKNFFISKKNYVPFSRYSSFCIFNHPIIYQISDITMSISTWDKVHFWIYLLNHKSWSHQTWPVDRYQQVQ